MRNDPVRVGRIPLSLQRLIGRDFGDNIFVYIGEEALRDLVRRYPNGYLAKIEECGRIIKKPLYVGYDEKADELFLVRDYIVQNRSLHYVLLSVKTLPQMRFHRLEPINAERFAALGERLVWFRHP